MNTFLRMMIALWVCAMPAVGSAQVAVPQAPGRLLPPATGTPNGSQESLLIGPGDVLHVQVVDAPEMEQHVRVTDNGMIPLVGAGDVKVGGMTVAAAETAIHDHLIATHYMNHPQVLVTVEEYATETVSVVGEVARPGVFPITTPRTVLDVLSFAGGITNVADRNIMIQRHGSKDDTVPYYVSNDPKQAVATQVMVDPGDTVIVPKAGIVYILGDVNRPGGFAMSNNEDHMTLLQALALAGGLQHSAKQGHARLIRVAEGGQKEQQLNLDEIQKGKRPNPTLYAGDILFVPFSWARNLANLGAPGVASAAASAAVYAAP
ncbi:MAG TPA: polysaccharide biosynthesis/export family protein [Acidobacteriaceae bacterium]|jgi:polysaccharide export outer membrane protein